MLFLSNPAALQPTPYYALAMPGWTTVPQEAGVAWVTVCAYGEYSGGERKEGHLSLLPGDVVVPQKQHKV